MRGLDHLSSSMRELLRLLHNFGQWRNGLVCLEACVNYLVFDLLSEDLSNVGHLLLDQLLKELLKAWQNLVLHVIVP